jgi:hypothetical protein
VSINLLDSHAGSPPSAVYFLQHLAVGDADQELMPQLEKWEIWCAELLETHISYPVLAFYRSQHDDQSWVAALIMILDTAALVLVSEDSKLHANAKSTFAIARHAAIDLTIAFYLSPKPHTVNRMTNKDLITIRALLKKQHFPLRVGKKADEKLLYLRSLYEPYMQALSEFFLMPITPFIVDGEIVEAWRHNV